LLRFAGSTSDGHLPSATRSHRELGPASFLGLNDRDIPFSWPTSFGFSSGHFSRPLWPFGDQVAGSAPTLLAVRRINGSILVRFLEAACDGYNVQRLYGMWVEVRRH